MLLGVDVGGTFTDAVLVAGGRVVTAKQPTTPTDQSEGVLAAVHEALDRAGAQPGDLEAFAHGMTVATNALLEGEGARTALVATAGFEDLEELGRQARADLYRLCAGRPAPIVAPEARVGARERTGPDGVIESLSDEALDELGAALEALAPEAVAVCLLHSYRHPEHEQRIGAALRKRLPDVHVSLSHEVAGVFREFERTATTTVDATLSPLLAAYLGRLRERTADEGLPTPSVMQSSGGVASLAQAAAHASWTVLSGPAGGAAGAAVVARATGRDEVLCFDMGGTSCDVCVVEGGAVRETAGRDVGGRPIALPMLDLETVGAGGGSIGWRDPGGALRVGPRSAGAEPGPACYGRGGTEPTVTDANLVLGLLPADGALAGGVALDGEAAERAVTGLADSLGLSAREAAAGIIRVANAEMLRALRVMTVERGIDPRGYALLAFGGAGGLHAAAIADELGMTTVLCPRASGVLAALGLVAAERRADVQRSLLLSGDAFTREAVSEAVAALGSDARDELGEAAVDAELRTTCELRYRGQAFELSVAAGQSPDPASLAEDFHGAHEERYGYADREAAVELVTVRVTATLPGPDVELAPAEDAGFEETARTAVLGGEEVEAAVLRGEPPADFERAGPALVELRESTLAVPPGWTVRTDDSGTLVMEKDA